MTTVEPKRQTDLALLWAPFQKKVRALFAALDARGFDPVAFEALRIPARQEWLYANGRTRHLNEKPDTWTHHSKHMVGKACDIVSKSRWWGWDEFYDAMEEEALRLGLRDCNGGKTFRKERCHVQWGG